MSIRRQYSLPNCTLVLEGMSDKAETDEGAERPLLSILVNAECHFEGHSTSLSGSRAFLESLVRSVSAYAQEFLSGIVHPQAMNEERVRFERLTTNHLHRLIWQPETDHNGADAQPIALDLTTVQLFDLLEAVDQCLADHRTLPGFNLELVPVSRRYRKAEVPVTQRIAPAALGISGLVVAAAALFFVPVPEVREGELVPTDAEIEEIIPEETEGTEPDPLPTEPDSNSESPTTPQSLNLDISPEVTLAEATEITDPTQLWYLQRNLYRTLDQAWDDRATLETNSTYRVWVTPGGLIVNYEPVADTPAGIEEATPLPEIARPSTPTETDDETALADYRVVFTRRGILQVSPWNGYQGEPTLGQEITNLAQLERLQDELYQNLAATWQGVETVEQDLAYRVGVTKTGVIADYQADNQAAVDYVEATPLPELWQPEAAGIGVGENASVMPKEPLAQYEVVLKADGTIAVQPWEQGQ